MKKLLIIMGLLLIAAPVMGATTPTPTPVPNIIPDGVGGDIPMVIRASFTDFSTGAITDHKLTSDRTGAAFTVPNGHRFYITGISWSCLSAVTAMLEWDGTPTDTPFDYAYFPFTGQGKVMYFNPPITSLDAGISPVLTTDQGATGWCSINGYLR